MAITYNGVCWYTSFESNTTSFMVVKAFTTDHYTCIAIVGFALNTLLIADKKHG